MYFDNIDIIDLNKIISKDYNFYAHLKNIDNDSGMSIVREYLSEHTSLCYKYFNNICASKNLFEVFSNFEECYLKDASNEVVAIFREILINTICFHDVGKINPYFQIKNMNNTIDEDTWAFSPVGSRHSIISSVLYIDYYLDKVLSLENKEEKKKLRLLLFINAYVISKHHSNLDEFFDFLNTFISKENGPKDGIDVIEIFNDNYKNVYLKEFKLSAKKAEKQSGYTKKFVNGVTLEESVYLYTYCKLMFSLLVACDYYATTEFMSGTEITSFGDIEEIEEIYDVYKDTDVYCSIREYEKEEYFKENKDFKDEKEINILRNEMFLDSEKELIKYKDKNIFFLEAPTGSGKSNVSMNLSFKLIEDNNSLKKIFYVYPFNTLVEQNLNTLYKTFGENKEMLEKAAVINSVYPIKVDIDEDFEDEEKYKEYSKALLNRQFLNYPLVLTTHVSLFNTMFGYSKENSFAFHQLAHSVIVLDEIQSYKNIIWSEIISFLNGFAKILGMKIIIMSATLPDLEALIPDNYKYDNSVSLIKDRNKFFSNPLFKERVKVNYELLDDEDTLYELYNHVKENGKRKKKILIEFIKKKSAYDFYNELKDDFAHKDDIPVLELMTGDDNVIERYRILKSINSEEAIRRGIILVATQVIEAGVDIDMDIGYKDISKLDSDEQFMGRINRSCRNSGEVYFFNLDKTDSIYKNDLRANKDLSLLDDEMKNILLNKNFSEYYKPVLDLIRKNYNESYSDSNLNNFFEECVGRLNFKAVEKRMRLIDDNDWNMSVFLGRVIKDEYGKEIHGVQVWNDYKELLMDNRISYAEKQVRLSKVKSLMNYFIYEIKKNIDLPYNDKIGELYFIENGERYFEGEKLDKEKFASEGGLFLDL
ncbi:MAG TPA: CRISPR-associated helicase/endonuclease Cas3 [Clostridium sp.]|nr:CRISPR-associated helicase/endonuclease Cas3 [Clostridium sp.]